MLFVVVFIFYVFMFNEYVNRNFLVYLFLFCVEVWIRYIVCGMFLVIFMLWNNVRLNLYMVDG